MSEVVTSIPPPVPAVGSPALPSTSSTSHEEDHNATSSRCENEEVLDSNEINMIPSGKSRVKDIGQEHSFLMDRSDVEQMEQGLLNLLDDFKHGRLHAFGGEFSMEKMNRVRNLQVTLAQLHFDLEEEETMLKDEATEDGEERKGHEKLDKLMKNLENLCSSLQSLHQPDKE